MKLSVRTYSIGTDQDRAMQHELTRRMRGRKVNPMSHEHKAIISEAAEAVRRRNQEEQENGQPETA